MKKLIFLIFAAWCLTSTSYAQEIEVDKVAQESISKLAFIVGDWSGEGWMMGPDGTKYPFSQTEKISFKLDSTAILIEGLGKDGAKTIHNAMAVVTYNKPESRYDFRSYLSNGRSGIFKGELIDDKFYWYPGENMRYIIYLNEQGQWYEKGEIKRNEEWFQFFEMTLNKD